MAENKNIVVCLSKDTTFFSGLTYLLDNGGFTHASLGLSDDAEFYYSFNFKGMKREYRTSLKKKPRQMVRFIVSVPCEAHETLSGIIDDMMSHRENYKYAQSKVVKTLLSIPNKDEKDDRFFCSQFVATVLKESGCVDISPLPADCTPNDILKELKRSGQIVDIEQEAELENPGAALMDNIKEKVEAGHDKVSAFFDMIGLNKPKENGKKASVAAAVDKVFDGAAEKLEDGRDAIKEVPRKVASVTTKVVEKGSKGVQKVVEKLPIP